MTTPIAFRRVSEYPHRVLINHLVPLFSCLFSSILHRYPAFKVLYRHISHFLVCRKIPKKSRWQETVKSKFNFISEDTSKFSFSPRSLLTRNCYSMLGNCSFLALSWQLSTLNGNFSCTQQAVRKNFW